MNRDSAKVKALLQSGADPNASDTGGWTALRFAVNSDAPEVVSLLVQAGADTGALDKFGSTPVHDSLSLASAHAFQQLMKEGADFTVRNGKGQTPLEELTETIGVFRNSSMPDSDVTATRLSAMRVLLLQYLSKL
ncbi:ankyrin repeat domain-containing protein [Microbacterium sp.]|uniref:ankyrin repeat domain-containing protein n=1 Tax=Microbacterium sp. TaxID=51671 RepID=UPI003C1CCBB9